MQTDHKREQTSPPKLQKPELHSKGSSIELKSHFWQYSTYCISTFIVQVEMNKSETAGTHFNKRVVECRMAAQVTRITFLFSSGPTTFFQRCILDEERSRCPQRNSELKITSGTPSSSSPVVRLKLANREL